MSDITKTMNQFDGTMKQIDKLSNTVYKATGAKRKTLTVPYGVMVYDTTDNKFYMGDGTTKGGISDSAKIRVRGIPVYVADSTGVSANATTDQITWTTYGGKLRTADAITLATGSGTIPSGLSPTTYYVVKATDDPASDSFQVATTRANAIAGTVVDILSSGAAGYTSVIAQVAVQGFEDILFINPVQAAVTVYLPYPTIGTSPRVTIKRAAAGNFNVTIAALDSTGAAATLSLDDVSANVTMGSGTIASGITMWGDPDSHKWYTDSKVNS
jgi:hypothetical protein